MPIRLICSLCRFDSAALEGRLESGTIEIVNAGYEQLL